MLDPHTLMSCTKTLTTMQTLSVLMAMVKETRYVGMLCLAP